MGESLVDAPKVENKMGESGMDVGALHVSVSFGRFENDSLCWEKWSAFPANKYLEEVEKFSTPGSVAQKKAYFEAHYKKIAERKAEQVDQEKKNGDSSVVSEHQTKRDLVNNDSVKDIDLAQSNGHSSLDADEIENVVNDVNNKMNGIAIDGSANGIDIVNGSAVGGSPNGIDIVNGGAIDDSNNESNIVIDSAIDDFADGIDMEGEVTCLRTESSSSVVIEPVAANVCNEPVNELDIACGSEDLVSPAVDAKVESNSNLDDLKMDKPDNASSIDVELVKETGLVIEDAPSLESIKQPDNASSIEVTPTPRAISGQRFHSVGSKKSEKATTVKKATNIPSTKKKQSAPAVRSPVVSTPKMIKPTLSRPVTSATKRPTEKKNGFTPQTGKMSAPAASRRVASPSLHMSLNCDPANSDPGLLAMTRKSLIMERMGDKDIIKRAFRTFQNNFGQVASTSSSSFTKSSPNQQIPRKETERKTWASTTPRKSIEGSNNLSKMFSVHGQQSTRKTSSSTGSFMGGMGSGRSGTTVSPSFGTKSHDRVDKLKGFTKKPGEEISAKDAERTLLHSKMKAQKDVELKKLQQSLNFKAKPLPAFYRGSGVGKSSAHKKDVKSESTG